MNTISIVIPCYNEEGNIIPLFDELRPELRMLSNKGYSWECIFIDDGSTDETLRYLDYLKALHNNVILVKHDINKGVGSAYQSGFLHARGDYIITLSADREIPPVELGKVLEFLEAGSEFVNTNRSARWGNTFMTHLKWNIPSKIVNRTVSAIVGKTVKDVGSGLKGFHRSVLEDVQVEGSRYLYFPAYASLRTPHFKEIDVEFRPREWGQSSRRPIHLAKEVVVETPRLLWYSLRNKMKNEPFVIPDPDRESSRLKNE